MGQQGGPVRRPGFVARRAGARAVLWTALLASAAQGAPPSAPTAPTPPDGASGIGSDPLLCVEVSDPQAEPLGVEFFGRDLTAVSSPDFSLVFLPDTQFYSESYPQLFDSQVRWIVENREALGIAFVSHAGDLVENSLAPLEWQIASRALARLEDPAATSLPDGIPYGISVGNHDNRGNAGTLTNQSGGTASLKYNETFGIERFLGRAYYGGHFGANNDNTYQLFRASGMDFIAIHLEYDTADAALRLAVLDWADGLLKSHPDRRAILTSHYLLDPAGNFGDGTVFAGNQGRATYEALKDNPNLFLMLCGHLWNNPHRSDTYEGHTIHTMMANYQHWENGGNGYLRLLTFSPSRNEIVVQTYSSWLDQYVTNSVEQFSVPYDMEGGIPFRPIGSLGGIPSGSTACLPWPGRENGGRYEWFVRVSDGTATTVGARSIFTSDGSCATPADCDDGDPCTTGACLASVCSIGPIPGCCVTDADCDDGNPCTGDSCQASTCVRSNVAAPCTDHDPCTIDDACELGVCSGAPLDCDDGNACTADSCVDGACVADYDPVGACCEADGDCDDGDGCTTDRCFPGGSCANERDPGCCWSEGECDDSDPCTAGACPSNRAAVYLDGLGAHVGMGSLVASENLTLDSREFTIEAWFEWEGGGATAATSAASGDGGGIVAYPLLAKGRDKQDLDRQADINYFLGIREPGHVLAADFEEHATGSAPGLNHPVSGRTVITTGAWHHAAATYDGCCWQLYLDGQTETDGTSCPAEPPNYESLAHFAIGTALLDTGASAGAFHGRLDEVRVWRRALGPSEIQAAMNRAIPFDPDLLGRWGLDEGAGYVARDSTGHGRDGKLVLAQWERADSAPALGARSCSSVPRAGCCHVAGDCEDANACTADSCVGNECRNLYAPVDGCCVRDADCEDGDPCTASVCDATGRCAHPTLDTDRDGATDCTDRDDDNDAVPDACDNCPATSNPGQANRDRDSAGDSCDLDDGWIQLACDPTGAVVWDAETGFGAFNVYAGDLALLSSDGSYTQGPGSSELAARICGQSVPLWPWPGVPDPGRIAFALVAGVTPAGEGSLGVDGADRERTNDHPCP